MYEIKYLYENNIIWSLKKNINILLFVDITKKNNNNLLYFSSLGILYSIFCINWFIRRPFKHCVFTLYQIRIYIGIDKAKYSHDHFTIFNNTCYYK